MGKKTKLIKNAQATKFLYDKIMNEDIEGLKNSPNLFDMKFTDVCKIFPKKKNLLTLKNKK